MDAEQTKPSDDVSANEQGNEELFNFVLYELQLLKPAKDARLISLVHYLLELSCKQFTRKISAAEKESLSALLIKAYQTPKLGMKNSYHPPFILKDNPERIISQQSISNAAKTFNLIYFPLMELIDLSHTVKMNRQQFSIYLKPLIIQCLHNHSIYLNAIELLVLETMLLDEMLGFGPLEPLLADPTVNDVLVNAPDQIYVERNGCLERTATRFRDTEHIMHIIQQIVSRAGRRIDAHRPYVNVKLDNGTRVNAVIPPVVLDSPTLSIRKFSEKPIYLDMMVENQNLSPEMAIFLNIAVKCRVNILISGGTGSGKTTLLNAMSDAIDDSERIITIEDVAELRLNKEHVVRLETRSANIEGGGSITERELVINALRMRPDRLIVGEVRGAEVFDMLQAMNTGHEGSMSTIHANRVEDVPFRFADMLAMANVGFTIQSSLQQIKPAINLIVHTSRLLDGLRRIVQISEITELQEGTLQFQNLFEFQYSYNEKENKIEGCFKQNKVVPLLMHKAVQFGLDKQLKILFRL